MATWANEQSIREIYLRPFEMCVKTGTVPLNYLTRNSDGSLRYQPDTQFTFDPDSVSDYHYGRQAAHHIFYTIANSKAMIGAMPGSKLTGMPISDTLRIVLTVVPLALIAALVFFTVRRFTRKAPIVVVESSGENKK